MTRIGGLNFDMGVTGGNRAISEIDRIADRASMRLTGRRFGSAAMTGVSVAAGLGMPIGPALNLGFGALSGGPAGLAAAGGALAIGGTVRALKRLGEVALDAAEKTGQLSTNFVESKDNFQKAFGDIGRVLSDQFKVYDILTKSLKDNHHAIKGFGAILVRLTNGLTEYVVGLPKQLGDTFSNAPLVGGSIRAGLDSVEKNLTALGKQQDAILGETTGDVKRREEAQRLLQRIDPVEAYKARIDEVTKAVQEGLLKPHQALTFFGREMAKFDKSREEREKPFQSQAFGLRQFREQQLTRALSDTEDKTVKKLDMVAEEIKASKRAIARSGERIVEELRRSRTESGLSE